MRDESLNESTLQEIAEERAAYDWRGKTTWEGDARPAEHVERCKDYARWYISRYVARQPSPDREGLQSQAPKLTINEGKGDNADLVDPLDNAVAIDRQHMEARPQRDVKWERTITRAYDLGWFWGHKAGSTGHDYTQKAEQAEALDLLAALTSQDNGGSV